MSQPCALKMRPADAESLGPLRRRDIKVCRQGESLWLRADNVDDELNRQLRALPGLRYTVLPDRQLVPRGRKVPGGYLPEGPWVDLGDYLSVRLQPAALAGSIGERIGLKIVRGGTPEPCNILATTIDRLAQYIDSAPQVRLDCWSFAAASDGQIVLRGTPLPPVAGERYVETAGIAVAAGWQWQPAIEAAILRQVLELEKDDLALLHGDGTWDHLHADDFVRATRSAVRVTREAAAND